MRFLVFHVSDRIGSGSKLLLAPVYFLPWYILHWMIQNSNENTPPFLFFSPWQPPPNNCSLCKNPLDTYSQTRPVNRTNCDLFGMNEGDLKRTCGSVAAVDFAPSGEGNNIHMMHIIEWIGENWMREFNFGTCLNPRAQRVGFRLFPKLNECIQFHWSTNMPVHHMFL